MYLPSIFFYCGFFRTIAWWGATGAAVLLTSNYPPLVALAVGAGFTGSWVLAGKPILLEPDILGAQCMHISFSDITFNIGA